MILAAHQHDWLQKLIAQIEPESIRNKTTWLQKIRVNAQRAMLLYPVLNRKQEAWRYNRIDKLFEKRFKLLVDDVDFTKLHIDDYLLPDFSAHRLIFINGRYAGPWSNIAKIDDNTTIGSLGQLIQLEPEQISHWFKHIKKNNQSLFSELNMAFLNDGAAIHIGDHIELDKPIEIIYLNTENSNLFNTAEHDGVITQIRNIISLGIRAKATLIERFIGTDQGQYFHNNLSDIVLAEGAVLKHYRVQDESPKAYHLSSLSLSQQHNSRYYGTHMAFGAVWSKTDINVDFKQEDAECRLNGLYIVADQQLTDFHIDVRHSVPSCTSREQFKGILYGKGRAVFDGHILVEKQAQQSDAQLRNDNLLLTRDAEVDTKPQLEIYADDVKCGHGTSIGQIDPQQLFYLRSRGLSRTAAYKLLCLGFAGEIIDSIDEKILSAYVAERLARTLNENALQ